MHQRLFTIIRIDFCRIKKSNSIRSLINFADLLKNSIGIIRETMLKNIPNEVVNKSFNLPYLNLVIFFLFIITEVQQ